MKSMLDALTKGLADKGLVIEAGAQGIRRLVQGLPDDQRYMAEMCYYIGAQHCFTSLMSFLDPGSHTDEPTATDMERMTKLNQEFEKLEPQIKAWVNLKLGD